MDDRSQVCGPALGAASLHDVIDKELQRALEDSWSSDTAAVDNNWSPENPAAGHCDVTSLVIRERMGGDLKMCQVFRDGVFSEHHYWNVLPDGRELDLTSSQFDGLETFGDATTLTAEVFAASGPLKPELVDRVNRYRAEVNRRLRAGLGINGQPLPKRIRRRRQVLEIC